jgi:molybdate transport system regulatory protein
LGYFRAFFRMRLAMLSARNQIPARVKSVNLDDGDDVMAEVVMEISGGELVAVITRGSAEALRLRVGDRVKAVVKATEILIDKP